MNRKVPTYLITVLMTAGISLFAQPVPDTLLLQDSLYHEQIIILTDRDLYGTGENIFFRMFNRSSSLLKKNGWSSVLYLELTNSTHQAVARTKYLIKPAGSWGALQVPDTIASGIYTLQAYTKWMRNFQPSFYASTPLAIVNPTFPPSTADTAIERIPGTPPHLAQSISGISCTTDKETYEKREKVSLTLGHSPHQGPSDGYCITVIRKGYLDRAFPDVPSKKGTGTAGYEKIRYHPENRGPSISGSVINKLTGNTLSHNPIYITIPGTEPDCFSHLTDRKGRFRFLAPQKKSAEIGVITPGPAAKESFAIILDPLFSTSVNHMSVPDPSLLINRDHIVEELLVTLQLKKAYASLQDEATAAKDKTDAIPVSFYGNPEYRYQTDDYIDLPNLQEFFFELIPWVQVRKSRNQVNLLLLDEYGLLADYPPLILLDFVPVHDLNRLLALEPALIDHIDVVNTDYVRGSSIYGGILSIVSDHGDRAGMGLPPGSVIFENHLCEQPWLPEFPEYGSGGMTGSVPDLRTTLFWHPKISFEQGSSREISFYTSDLNGTYQVLLRGTGPAGKPISSSCEFRVR